MALDDNWLGIEGQDKIPQDAFVLAMASLGYFFFGRMHLVHQDRGVSFSGGHSCDQEKCITHDGLIGLRRKPLVDSSG